MTENFYLARVKQRAAQAAAAAEGSVVCNVLPRRSGTQRELVSSFFLTPGFCFLLSVV
jgi:hypothetical protein